MKKTVKSTTFVQTVEKNMKGFTDNQQLRAKEARKAYHILFAPSMRSLKGVMRQNLFDNMPVTSEDIRIADKIYGPDISTLRGKTADELKKLQFLTTVNFVVKLETKVDILLVQ